MSDCCGGSECTVGTSAICQECGQKGKSVQKLTPENLLVEYKVSELKKTEYFFCPTKTCDVVYFTNDGNQYFKKEDVKVRVGSKETEDPIPVCYCFDFTRERIFDEIRTTGKSTTTSYITNKINAGECACEIKNPSGRCCLGEVNRTIKQAQLYADSPEALTQS